MRIYSGTAASIESRKKARLKPDETLPAWYLTKDIPTEKQKKFYRRIRVAFRTAGMEDLAPYVRFSNREALTKEISRLLDLAKQHGIWIKMEK